MATGALVSQLALWPFLRRYTRIVRIELRDCLVHLRPLIALFIPVVAVSIYTTLNKVMLGSMTSVSQVGQFDTAVKMMGIPLGLITALGIVMLPRMSNIIANKDKTKMNDYIKRSMEFVMFISLPIAFGLLAIAGTLVSLFLGKEYAQAGLVLAIVSPIVVFAAWANVLRTQFLIPTGRNKAYIISVVIGAFVSVGLNILLIPMFKSSGTAIAMVTAELFVVLYQTLALRKNLDMKSYLKSSQSFLIKSLIMFSIVLAIGFAIEAPLLRVTVQLLVGGGIYALLNLEYIDKTILNGKMKHPAWSKLLIAKKRLYAESNNINSDGY